MVKKLKEQLKEYQYLCNNLPDSMLILDETGKVLLISKKFAELSKYSEKELIGKRIFDLPVISKKDLPPVIEKLKRRLAGKKIPLYSIRVTTKTGKKLIAEINGHRIRYKGKYAALLVLRDVTEQKYLEKLVEESEERLRSIVQFSKEAIIVVDTRKQIVFWSRAAEDIFGYISNEIIGKPLSLIIPRRFHKTYEKGMKQLVSTGKSRIFEKMLEITGLKKDGTEFPMEISVTRWKIGGETFFTSIGRDITERKLMERELRIRNDAIESFINAIAFANTKGNITYVNPSFVKLWRYDSDREILGKPSVKFWKVEEKAKEVIKALRDEGRWIGELVGRRKDGSLFDVKLSATMVRDETGKPITMMASFLDITEQKRIDRAKSDFISLASHQLRTPLTTMSWHIETLLSGNMGKFTVQQKKYLKDVYATNQQLIKLVNAFLNVSRIEMGSLSIEPEPINFVEISDSALNEFSRQIKNKKLEIEKKYEKKLPIIMTDPYLIRIIFQNLLSNAVQYTPEKGRVKIEITKRKSDILITVADTGYGIPKAQQPKIFERLFRADNIKEKEPGGSGLGLYIIKALVKQSGGKMWFESIENKGSTFYVTIPLKGIKKRRGVKMLD